MAFSKIAGFDVTPPRPSSSTRRLSSPPAIRLRRMKSSHTDWPYCLRAATGLATAAVSEGDWLMAILRSRRRLAVALLERGDLGEAPHVPLLGRVVRADEGAHEIAGQSRPHDPAAETGTFMLSCSTPWCAEYESWQIAARMPGSLLAATHAPTPLPQMRTPRSARPPITAAPTASAKSG